MLASIIHIVNGDWASLVLDLTEMDVVPPNTNLRRVTMVIHQTVAVCVCIWRGGDALSDLPPLFVLSGIIYHSHGLK